MGMTSGNRWRAFLLDTVDRWQIWCEGVSTLVPRWRVDLCDHFDRFRSHSPQGGVGDAPVVKKEFVPISSPEVPVVQTHERVCEIVQVFPQVFPTQTEGSGLDRAPGAPTLI